MVVAIIGAGAAGIAAARRLRALGRDCVILEAGTRVGGRAFSESHSLGATFEHGANWLHEADANPLTGLAAGLGFAVHDTGARRKHGLRRDGVPLPDADHRAYQATIDAMEAAFEARAAAGGPDVPCAAVAPSGGAWDASAAWWLGDIINGAPLAAISVQDYAAIALGGRNLQLAAGLGTLLARLAEGLPVRLGRPVQLVGWDGPGITLQGPWGVLRAAACIVTVSTGVLAAGGLRFSPDLPAELGDAVAGLPMGLLSKVALQARGDGLLQARGEGSLKAREGDSGPGTARDRLDLPAFGRIERPFAGPGDAPMSWICWPFGRPYVVGFIGGPAAWELSRAGPAAAEAFARAELARHFGAARVARVFPPGAVVTGWGADPATLGAYTHARVGAAGARAVLRNAALASGRLRFAGEACHPRFAATLGGAWESGEAAAEAVAGLA